MKWNSDCIVLFCAAVLLVTLSPVLLLFWLLGDVLLFAFLGRTYLYNVSWEDPRMDLREMRTDDKDHVLTIASAGDNVFDFLTRGARVTAVDFNPNQLALAQLKAAAAATLPHSEYFRIFGRDDVALLRARYLRSENYEALREHAYMTDAARSFWDAHLGYGKDKASLRSIMYSGTSGLLAWMMTTIVLPVMGLGGVHKAIKATADQQDQDFPVLVDREETDDEDPLTLLEKGLLSEDSIDGQSKRMRQVLRQTPHQGRFERICRMLDHPVVLNCVALMAGVPTRQLLAGAHRSDTMRTFLGKTFLNEHVDMCGDNYFFMGYLTGRLTRRCRPLYMRPRYYARLQAALRQGKLRLRHSSLADQARADAASNSDGFGRYTSAALLDHMDWMSPSAVHAELASVVSNMDRSNRAQLFWRSFADDVHSPWLRLLQPKRCQDNDDRVPSYFGTWLADLSIRGPCSDMAPLNLEKHSKWPSREPERTALQRAVRLLVTGIRIVVAPVLAYLQGGGKATSHKAKMEAFYQAQKSDYDAFRENMLHARRPLIQLMPLRESEAGARKMVWIDIGGGTARNLEFLPLDVLRQHFAKIVVADISPSLLSMARKRLQQHGLSDLVTCIECDVTRPEALETLRTAAGVNNDHGADVVTFSYSLSMIPDRVAALRTARALLDRQRGFLGLADFVLRDSLEASHAGRLLNITPRKQLRRVEAFLHKHWFAQDNVHLLPESLISLVTSQLDLVKVPLGHAQGPFIQCF
ncbi:MAG: hypothetical protein MHM6MM_000846 [Cercozoa sp. M6MM]